MRKWLKELDDLLRGSKTHPTLMAEGTAHIRLGPLMLVSLILAIVYGVCMGTFSVFNRPDPQLMQLLASGLKVPALFLLTVVVTFPSLYVFGALLGVRLGPLDTLRLVVAPLAVNVAVLASFALITLFFTFCTTNYHFMKLLNFTFFTIAGLIGLRFLMNMLQRLEAAAAPPPPAQPPAGPEAEVVADPAQEPGDAPAEGAQAGMDMMQRLEATVPPPPTAQTPPGAEAGRPGLLPWPAPAGRTTAGGILRLWIVLYALVGAQMGWILRPFIGAPGLRFTWFRVREANIFMDLVRTIGELLGWS